MKLSASESYITDSENLKEHKLKGSREIPRTVPDDSELPSPMAVVRDTFAATSKKNVEAIQRKRQLSVSIQSTIDS